MKTTKGAAQAEGRLRELTDSLLCRSYFELGFLLLETNQTMLCRM